MATLTAVFRMVDEMSSRLDSIANSGESVVQQWGKIEDSANSALDTASTSANSAINALDNYERGIMDASNALDELSGAGRKSDEALQSQSRTTEQAEKAIDKYGNTTEDAGKKSEEFGKKSTDALQELSNALAAAGIAKLIGEIYDAFAFTVDKAIEFESAIAGVYKTVDGTSEQLAAISGEIKALSTVMPASAIEIAGVAEAAGQLGIATDDITAFTEVMINLGEATNLSADEAATALAKFTNITDTAASEYDNLGSTIVALGNNFATTEADIVAMSTRMASAGTLAGLSESDILALSAAVSSVGIEAEAGGSAMSKLLTDIQIAVETGSDRLEQFADVSGVTADEFSTAFGESAVDALYMFISGLNDVERNGQSATVILEDMEIREVRLSNAIKALANNHEGLSDAIGFASNAWEENTALATEADLRYGTLESRLAMTQNAADNLAAAFGDKLTPIVGGVADAGRDVLEWLTGVVEGSPAVTAAVSAGAVAMTALAGAVTVATIAQSKFVVAAIAAGKAMLTNPIFLAIAGITAAVAAFSVVMANQDREYSRLSASSKNQYDELEKLNDEYENAIAVHGHMSKEADDLRYRVDELTNSFGNSKKTTEQFIAEIDKLVEKHNNIASSYYNGIEEANDYEQSTLALIGRLEELATQNVITTGSQLEMETIIGRLNESIPGLDLNYESLINSIDGTVDAMERLAIAEAQDRKYLSTREAYVEALGKQEKYTNAVAEAEANLAAERERRGVTFNEEKQDWYKGADHEDSRYLRWFTEIDEYKGALEKAQQVEIENNKIIADGKELFEERERAAEESANAIKIYEEGIKLSIESVSDSVKILTEDYGEAYEAARASIDGQIGLFDTMKTATELPINDMKTAMESQIAYLERYNENLAKAADADLNTGFAITMDAGELDAVMAQFDELGGAGSQAAEEFIAGFNTLYEGVEAEKNNVADSLAKMEVDFDERMKGIESSLEESITNMNMKEGAKLAAENTLNAYINQIRSMEGDAESAALAVANATANALSSRMPTVPSWPSSGYYAQIYSRFSGSHADGLDYVPYNGYIAELHEGERVLTAKENRIFSTELPQNIYSAPKTSNNEKKIVLDINGSGVIDVTGTDGETVWRMVAPKLKDAFLGIVTTEMFEEGVGSYNF